MPNTDKVSLDINRYEDFDLMHENCIERQDVENMLNKFEISINDDLTTAELKTLAGNLIAELRRGAVND